MNWTAPYKNARRKFGAIAAAVALTCSMGLCSGCAAASTADAEASGSFTVATAGTASENVAADIQAAGYEFKYSDRDADASYDASSVTSITLTDGSATVSGDGATAEGSIATITEEGTYVISGTSSDGQVVVEVADDAKVQLVLDGVDLTCSSGPCIYVKSGDKVFVTLAEGSTNVLSDGSGWTLTGEDGEPNATLYSESDLTINGSGSLEVNGTVNHAISTKDDLTVTGGTLDIEAADDGLHGKDSVQINGGTITVDAQGDAIKSTETDKADKGFVSIDGGTLSLTSADDGIEASQLLRVTDGTLTIDSEDDALHSDIDVQITGGTVTIDAVDDAVHGEYNVSVEGGKLTVNACEEGLEGQCVEVAGGENYVASNDDGINASAADVETTDAASDSSAGSTDNQANDQAPQQGQGQGPQGGNSGQEMQGGMMGDVEEECNITISGGTTTLVCLHDGDSIDSNGSFTMTDGTVHISGTTSNGNGALDAGTGSTITGGTILALSSNGMAETFGTDSTQASIVSTVSGSAGDTVSIVDESGNEVANFTAVNDYSWLLASAPGMTEGSSYDVMINGSQATTLTASTEQQGGAMGGGMGGGQMPGGGQAPSDAESGQGPAAGGNGQMPQRGERGQMPSNGNTSTNSSVQGTVTSA